MEDYAVFEIIGEDWEQHSVWLDETTARAMKESLQNRYADKSFYLLQRIDV